MDKDKYIPLREFARLLSIHPITAEKWLVTHNIRHVRIPSGVKGIKHVIRVWEPDVEALLEKFRVKAEPEPKRKPGRPRLVNMGGKQ